MRFTGLSEVEMLGRDWILEKAEAPDLTEEERNDLLEFDIECANYWGDSWQNSEMTLISEDAFEDYAYDLFLDIYDIPEEARPYIDVEGFARDLKYDYTPVTLWNYTFYGLD